MSPDRKSQARSPQDLRAQARAPLDPGPHDRTSPTLTTHDAMPTGATAAPTAAGSDWRPIVREPLAEAHAAVFAPMFKALGDPVRLRLLSMIASAGGGEACVCDLTGSFALTGPTISHHLKVLREAGLVDSDRRGTWVYYRLVPAALVVLGALLEAA